MPRDLLVHRIVRGASITGALFALAVVMHWVLVRPRLGDMQLLGVPMFLHVLFGSKAGSPPPPSWFSQLQLILLAVSTTMAAALSLVLAFRARASAATSRLMASMGSGAAAASYFFFVLPHPSSISSLGLEAANARMAASFLAYVAAFVSACLLARFFAAYPRLPSREELEAFHRQLQAERLEKARAGWRTRVFGRITSSQDRPEGSFGHRWRAWLEAQQVKAGARAFLSHRAALAAAVALALVCTVVDRLTAHSGTEVVRIVRAVTWLVATMALITAFDEAFKGLAFHHRKALPEDRARVDWIYGTLLVCGLLVAIMTPLWWALLIVVLPQLEGGDALANGPMTLFGPIMVDVELLVLAFLFSIGLSMFYRGAVDPRLALRRVTIFGVVGIAVAVAFVLVERLAVVRLVAWFQMPPESGAWLAGVAVAVTLAPLRKTAEGAVNGLVARFLPIEALVQGERRVLAVVLCDLAGYTRLSATDEPQAMLLAALLQRRAHQLAASHGGRIVKTMGDAVMVAFPSARDAADMTQALHAQWADSARALGLEPLPMHTGAHFGEVTQTHDGDLYGQTVNIAARLQSSAAEGQRMVSAAFAAAAGLPTVAVRTLGERNFKNVPQPVDCLELLESPVG